MSRFVVGELMQLTVGHYQEFPENKGDVVEMLRQGPYKISTVLRYYDKLKM